MSELSCVRIARMTPARAAGATVFALGMVPAAALATQQLAWLALEILPLAVVPFAFGFTRVLPGAEPGCVRIETRAWPYRTRVTELPVDGLRAEVAPAGRGDFTLALRGGAAPPCTLDLALPADRAAEAAQQVEALFAAMRRVEPDAA